MKARIHVDAFPDLELPGHVFSVAAMPKTGGMRVNFLKEIPVKVKLDKMDPRVIPDLSVSVDVITEEEDASTVVPLSAVFQDSAARHFVYVRTPTGWDKRSVQLGLSSNVHVSVKSGLQVGEVVAEETPPIAPAGNQPASS